MPIMRCTLPEGGEGWKWGEGGKCYADRADAERQAEAAYANGYTGDQMTFDRSVRTRSVDGYLHIEVAHISKAAVNPYRGSEIPQWRELGLEADTIYQVWRPAEELERAASTANRIPMLSEHIAVTADLPNRDAWIGCTGESAVFQDPFLDNSLTIWDGEEIAAIENDEKRELSCAYRYRAIREPGTTNGVAYDLKMADIVFNHVALVKAGRAGPDVMVGDSRAVPMKSKKALLVRGALRAYVAPFLAADARLDFNGILGDVNRGNYLAKKPVIATRLATALGPLLAADAKLDEIKPQIPTWLGALDAEEEEGEDEIGEHDDGGDSEEEEKDAEEEGYDEAEAACDAEEEKEDKEKGAEDRRKRAGDRTRRAGDRMRRAKDRKSRRGDKRRGADEEKRVEDARKRGRDALMAKRGDKRRAHDGITQAAMDAAITAAVTTATAQATARMQAIRDAERAVAPWTGELAMTMDSAAAVYRFALEGQGVDVAGVDPTAYPAMLKLLPKPGEAREPTRAFDGDAANEVHRIFPALSKIRVQG
jgi:hypothetical protein